MYLTNINNTRVSGNIYTGYPDVRLPVSACFSKHGLSPCKRPSNAR